MLLLILTTASYAVAHPSVNQPSNVINDGPVLMPADTVEPKKDTTRIKFKDKEVRITEDEKGTDIEVKEESEEWDFDDEDWGHEWDDDEGPNFDFDFGEEDDFDVHWAGFEFGPNNFLSNDFSMNLKPENQFMELNTGKSWNINVNFLEYDLNLIGENFGIGTGLGIEFNDYRFDNQLPIVKEGGGIQVDSSYHGNDYSVSKAKLTTTYLTVPLILEYQVKPGGGDNKLFLSAGIIGGVKIGSHTKVKFDRDGDSKKNKERSDFYLSPFRYGYTVRAGYGFLKLFANYYDTALFQSGKGPQIHPFTLGFMISF